MQLQNMEVWLIYSESFQICDFLNPMLCIASEQNFFIHKYICAFLCKL